MKFARYEAHGEIAYGVVEGDVVRQITSTPFEEYKITDHQHPLSQVKLLAPCTPAKIFFMGGNYLDHLGGSEPPKEPQVYYKMPNAIMGIGDTIVLPKNAGRVDEEAEAVAVIGRRCSKASKADALNYVLGYTCGNDVSAREWQSNDGSMWRGKSSDTFAPIGPYLVTDLDGSNLEIRCRVNGKEVQHCNTKDLVFDVPAIINFISQSVTLEPGDIIFTGTSGVPATLHDGDVVEIEVQGIGTLHNPVEAE